MANQGSITNSHVGKSKIEKFGLKISTQQIEAVPIEQQELGLDALGVSVYQQDDFEQAVIEQVDSFLYEKEVEIATRAAEKELQDIREDIRNTENELQNLDEEIAKFGEDRPQDYDLRRFKEALQRQRNNKISQHKKLQAREKYAIKRLADREKLKHDFLPESSGSGIDLFSEHCAHTNGFHSEETDADSSRNLRCFQPLDNQGIGLFNDCQGNFTYESVKSRKRKSNLEFGDSDSFLASDEEFVPFEHEESSEEDEAALIECERNRKKSFGNSKRKIGLAKPHKELRSKLTKSRQSRKDAKFIDDGDDEAFEKRIRLLKLKKKLKDKGEWDSSYAECLSDDGLEEDDSLVSVSGDFKVPNRIWNRLYKYQKTGVKWLWQLHSQQAGGIVGDEMGLGKTIQVISLLAGLAASKIGRYASGRIGLGPVLIVCPATVLHQWVREFHRWWPRFRVAVLHETGSFSGKKHLLISKIVRNGGILVTSYSNMRINQDELHGRGWDYIILDEGHKIRNPDAEITLAVKQFSTPHRLILSGSPMQNNLKELWSLIDFVFPGKLGTLPVFMAEFSVPITIGGYSNATDIQVQTAYKCACILRDTINPYLLRRLKKDVKTNLQLPTKNEQVLFCRLTDEQTNLYQLYLKSREVSAILDGRMKVFPGLIMLRKICNHPDLTSAAGSLEWMKEKEEKAATKSNRKEQPDEIEYEGGYGFWQRSGKLIVVEALLRLWKKQGHRVLLFSQTRQMLDILESFVKEQGYTYMRMDGSTSIASRQPAVQKFNSDTSIFVYLLTTRVGGLGLNLIGADRIVIYDPDWNPSTDTQARERSWRIGQNKHVTIYRLLTTGTIEEKIYHRQIFKQFLTNRVLTNPMQRRFFKSNDLFELFTLGDTRSNHGTETSAIFAGTGSEVKVRRKKSDVDEGKQTKKLGKLKEVRLTTSEERQKRIIKELPNPDSRNGDAWTITAKDLEELSSRDSNDSKSFQDGVSSSTIGDVKSSLLGNQSVNVLGNDIYDRGSSSPLQTSSVDKKVAIDKVTMACSTCSHSDTVTGLPKVNESSDVKNEIPSTSRRSSFALKSEITDRQKDKRFRKKKRKKHVKVDGVVIDNLDRRDYYNNCAESDNEDDRLGKVERDTRHDEEILTSLFRSSGVHSALKHDKIEDPNNPDFVLVEKEAERVAKQAAESLRRSRHECRQNVVGVPTWTGFQGSAGRPGPKPRFGLRKEAVKTQVDDINEDSCSDDNKKPLFSGKELLRKNKDGKCSAPSSSDLLAKMRNRNTTVDLPATSMNADKTNEDKLVEEIRDFVAYRAMTFGQATTQEILTEFQSRIQKNKNALFRELLKQVCYLRKVEGVGTWFLKEEYQ